MKTLKIVLKITDPQVVQDYAEVAPELVLDDLKYGDLLDFTEIVSVEVVSDLQDQSCA